jgi:nucleotide-binding universal stress UspA family protein
MTVVCGTDFSSGASAAATAASAIAKRWGMPCLLVHVTPDRDEREAEESLARLRAQAERLRATGVEVEELLEHGDPEQALSAVAQTRNARL